MKYWWVNHKQTYREELGGGYIWSPKANNNNSTNQTYLNLTRVDVNDIIFSYAGGVIKAVGRIRSKCKGSVQPADFGKAGEQWAKNGWLVQVEWSTLEAPVAPKEHLQEIAPLLPKKYSPIRPTGDGNQKCYLAEIGDSLGNLLMKLTAAGNEETPDILEDLGHSIIEDAEEERLKAEEIAETEKEQLVKARRGQGVFRLRLEQIEKACRLTGVKDKRLLVASHIKPWRASDNREKLDGNNGLLLSPHVDRLFDRGWISFSDDGQILCAEVDIQKVMARWGLDPDKSVGTFNRRQKEYLAYHRDHIHAPRVRAGAREQT